MVLGAVLLDNESFFDDTVDLLSTDFFLDSHRKIYSAINDILLGMIEGVKTADIVTLSNELRTRREIDTVGGVQYLASLTEGLPSHPVIEQYVSIIKDKARLRKLLGILKAGIARAEDQSQSAADVMEGVQEELITETAQGADHSVEIGSLTPTIETRLQEKRVLSEERTALELTWGLSGLDDFTKGAFAGEFTIISAESSGGKTAFAVQMTLANAREGIPCAWFSLEMSKEKIAQRYYPAMSDILTANHTRDPRLMNTHTHVPEMKRISAELSRLPIRIDDTSPLRIDKLRARIRMVVKKFNVRLAIVDYIQIVEGMPGRSESEQFKSIIYMLRDIPKYEPTLHLVALSQYSKSDGFLRKKGRTKDSLYGGSVSHHAAQNLLMINVEDPEKRDKNDLIDVEINIAKQREGRVGKVTCNFDRDHLRFCYPQPPLMR